jgi:type IV pilus assembly protein PilA
VKNNAKEVVHSTLYLFTLFILFSRTITSKRIYISNAALLKNKFTMNLGSKKNKRANLRGFTLIELLVVIAIIGILSAVVLAALNTARSKGNDASIKSDLNTIQTQMALDSDSNGGGYGNAALTYAAVGAAWTVVTSGTCAPGSGTSVAPCGISTTAANLDTSVANALNQAQATIGSTGKMQINVVTGTSPSFMVNIPLTTTTGQSFCVDSAGKATVETTVGGLLAAGLTACP